MFPPSHFADPPDDDDNSTQRHTSKILAQADVTNHTLKVIVDCDVCGRFEIEGISIFHLSALSEVFKQIAEQLGVAPLTQELVEKTSAFMDKSDINDAEARFNAMQISPYDDLHAPQPLSPPASRTTPDASIWDE